ncbi:MAG TPA: bifunctional diaminohydroxyphosphoribosylaminopyrimidine deaminase/5-amino-6-(5-phosphoribosylamino)uracil reductase RibD [Vicinamibacterales bacterium]|nr:bifunctional diaminohydroxyphosphoribosylaminopyrimidine deaminase/5-amino-6-(5-phosphoribosylamino)uracil reductase RibD [Vicinamibacterales bacterium]
MPADDAHMRRALALAARGRGRTSPNPMVGAVVVDDEGVVVGRGWHEAAGGPHAEVHALRDAGARARGATLYCTLEPCSHTGRTGPCAPLVIQAGIRRVVVATVDPNPVVAGRGLALLKSQGVEVITGVLGAEAAALNRPFFTVMRAGRPFVTAKVALSLDARVAAAPGSRTRMTGEPANARVHRERAETDAIGVGSGTILDDDPLLTARGVYRARPLTRVIFDARLRTPASARVLTTLDAGPVIIVTSAANAASRPEALNALQRAGADVQSYPEAGGGRPALTAVLKHLAGRELTSLILEGGPRMHQAAWDAGVVDRVQMIVAPRPVGPDGVKWIDYDTMRIGELHDLSCEPVGEDVFIEGYVHRAD